MRDWVQLNQIFRVSLRSLFLGRTLVKGRLLISSFPELQAHLITSTWTFEGLEGARAAPRHALLFLTTSLQPQGSSLCPSAHPRVPTRGHWHLFPLPEPSLAHYLHDWLGVIQAQLIEHLLGEACLTHSLLYFLHSIFITLWNSLNSLPSHSLSFSSSLSVSPTKMGLQEAGTFSVLLTDVSSVPKMVSEQGLHIYLLHG